MEITTAERLLQLPHLVGDALMPEAIGCSDEKLAMFLELFEPHRGTPRALLLDMQDIEMLNVDQIATVTDLLLLRARHTNRRFSASKHLFAADHKRPSYREIAPIPSLVGATVSQRALQPDIPELTLFVRAKRFSTSTASAALVATLFAIAIAVTSIV